MIGNFRLILAEKLCDLCIVGLAQVLKCGDPWFTGATACIFDVSLL